MSSPSLPVLVLLATLAPCVAAPQLVVEMAPERVAEAMQWGLAQQSLGLYEIRGGGKLKLGQGPLRGGFSTPFLRVALAARAARRLSRAFTPADVTPYMISPELRVYGFAQLEDGTRIANVESIALTPRGGNKTPLSPVSVNEASEEYREMFGARPAGRCLVAAFPISGLSDTNEIRIVYDLPAEKGSKRTRTETMTFRLNQLR